MPRSEWWMPWAVCLSAGLFFFYEFFQLNLFDVINQPLRDQFKLDATQLSWMSSGYIWANVLFLIPAGSILDRFSPRRVILLAMLSCILGTVGFVMSKSFFSATVFHAITGIGNAFSFLSCAVLISRWFPPRRQALAIGCVVTMAFLGGFMAHTPFAWLNQQYGWHYALLIDAAVGVCLFFVIALVVKDQPVNALKIDKTIHAPNFWHVVRNHQNWLAGFYTACLNLPIMVLCALWGDSYLQIVHHLKPIVSSNVVSLIFIGSIIGCPVLGWLSDIQGRRKPLMIIGAIGALAAVIPLLSGIFLSKIILSILFFSLGFFTSTQVISYPLIAESNSTTNTGAATAIASFIIMGFGGIGQVLFGLLMQYYAGSSQFNYSLLDFQFAFLMFPCAIILALFSMFWIRETYCKQKELVGEVIF